MRYYNKCIPGVATSNNDEVGKFSENDPLLIENIADIVFHLEYITKNITLHALRSNSKHLIHAAKKKKLHEVSGKKRNINRKIRKK